MSRIAVLVTVLAGVLVASAYATAPEEPGAGPLTSTFGLREIASGLESPLYVGAPRSEPNRLYVVEQVGRIRVIENGRLRDAPFLDIRNIVSAGGEQGLLGLAFHPKYASNRKFYVHYSDRNGDTRVAEYRSNGTRALTGTRRALLFVNQPYSNHNGGQLAFGADGRLYLGLGDGGAGGDPENRAQNLGTRLGKLLVLNVDRRGAKWQINASGLRNPWRFSFDRANGDLYIGDVGQGDWEEVDYTPRRQLRTFRNYGWDVYEGRARFENKRPTRGKLVFPIAVYGREGGNCTIIGGHVYRGSEIPAARGRYYYGDFCSGMIWSLRVVGGRAQQIRREPYQVQNLSSFGEDAAGELYLTSLAGKVYKMTP